MTAFEWAKVATIGREDTYMTPYQLEKMQDLVQTFEQAIAEEREACAAEVQKWWHEAAFDPAVGRLISQRILARDS